MTDIDIATERTVVLKRARNLIEVEGWVQDTYFEIGKGRCSLGAISLAASEREAVLGLRATHDMYVPARSLLAETIEVDEVVDPYSVIVEWNDDPERTVEEVLDMFEKTIKRSTNDA